MPISVPVSTPVQICISKQNGCVFPVQIKHSYGAKPNEDFLQYYGFVDAENIHDAYSADLLQYATQHFQIAPQKLQAVQGQATLHQALQQVSAAPTAVPVVKSSGDLFTASSPVPGICALIVRPVIAAPVVGIAAAFDLVLSNRASEMARGAGLSYLHHALQQVSVHLL